MTNPQQTALVTGATRGLGLGCAQELARKGFDVILTGRNAEKVAGEMPKGSKCQYINLDVSQEADLAGLQTRLKDQRIDILINNAGVYLDEAVLDGPPVNTILQSSGDILLKTLMSNVYGPYRLCQIIAPKMKAQGFGRIVNVSSGMGQLSEMAMGAPTYRISKSALNALTIIVSLEIGTKGDFCVNAVCPGWVRTDMGGKNATRELKQGVDSILWAALLPKGGPTGGFYRDGKKLDW